MRYLTLAGLLLLAACGAPPQSPVYDRGVYAGRYECPRGTVMRGNCVRPHKDWDWSWR